MLPKRKLMYVANQLSDLKMNSTDIPERNQIKKIAGNRSYNKRLIKEMSREL